MDRIADSQTVRLGPRQRAPLPLPPHLQTTIGQTPGPLGMLGQAPSPFAPQPTTGTPGTDGRTGQGAPGTEVLEQAKVKLSTVLDQADDTEIKAIGVQQLRELLSHWKGQ